MYGAKERGEVTERLHDAGIGTLVRALKGISMAVHNVYITMDEYLTEQEE